MDKSHEENERKSKVRKFNHIYHIVPSLLYRAAIMHAPPEEKEAKEEKFEVRKFISVSRPI